MFCDSRRGSSSLAPALRAQGVDTFVSHSSLGLDERRRAEEAFATGDDCVIVATSTLELGIDVGDLDRVIQIDAPSTVSSFLQRMGRTGRRTGSKRNCLFLTTSDEAFLQAAGILRLWGDGWVEPVVPPAEPVHLFAQQVMALIFRNEDYRKGTGSHGSAGSLTWCRLKRVCTILAFMRETGVIAPTEVSWRSVHAVSRDRPAQLHPTGFGIHHAVVADGSPWRESSWAKSIQRA